MTLFWIFIALTLLVSLLLIWLPHFRQQRLIQAEEAGVRNQTNVELFNERLAALEKEHQEQLLDHGEFDALKQELELNLLQDMQQGTDESLSKKVKPKGIFWPISMSILIIAIAGYAYLELGAYKELPYINNPQSDPHQGMSKQQLIAQEVAMYEAQVNAQPENSQAWFNLGHAYISAKQYDDAVTAFDKVIELVGPHAELFGPKATALYYKNNQTITPQIQELINKALEMDPHDPSTLLLVGMNAFFNDQYQTAIDAWESILKGTRPDIDREGLNNAISAAKMRIATVQESVSQKAKSSKNASDKKVTLKLNIAPELKEKVADTDVIFVFARATEGSKMPLAATKISAKDLPAQVILDNSTSMGGEMTLSDAKNVEVIAVLSKHGSVRPQPGDIQGSLASVPVGDTATLVLNNLVN